GGASGPVAGKRGGGVVRLTIGGTLTVDGAITADGADGSGNYSGAGSGGSIWITATTLAGAGAIHANGGAANFCGTNIGTGGGGRVALYGAIAPSLAVQARGGSAAGAGSYYKAQTAQTAQLI